MSGQLTKLGDIAEFIRGITFKPDDVIPIDADDAVVCMRTKNVQTLLDCDDLLAVPSEFVRRKDQYLEEGDILVSSANSWNLVGKCSWVPNLPWRAAFGGFVSVLRGNPNRVDRRYLYWWFASDRIQALLRSFGQKTTNISNLNIGRCLELELHLPPLPEQRRIAAILDKADALRTKRREALAQLDRLAQSIFVEMFGSYEKGAVLWPVAPLGELASDMTIGLVRSADEFGEDFSIPYVRMNALGRSGEFFPALVQRTNVSEQELVEYSLQPGDLLFNTRNSKELVGKTAIFNETGPYVYNNNLMRIRFNSAVVPEYVGECFLTPFIQQELEFRKSGTTSVFAIYGRDLKTLPIPVPPVDLQMKFAERMRGIHSLRTRMSEQEVTAAQVFGALQNRAFLGEL